uniref:DUF834 domain-containing protein n=1 Tax=Oryza nivara TaxID=4536 RepID=A0A0E0I1P9_ORYNI
MRWMTRLRFISFSIKVWALAGGEGSVLSIGRGWGRRNARVWVMKAGVATATRAHGRWRSSVFTGENPGERLEVRLGVARVLARRGTEGTTKAWARRVVVRRTGGRCEADAANGVARLGLGSDAAEEKEARVRCGTGVSTDAARGEGAAWAQIEQVMGDE